MTFMFVSSRIGCMEQIAHIWSASDAALVDQMCALETRMRQDYARMLQLLSELDSRGVAAKSGYSRTRTFLTHVLRISRSEANHRLTQAEDLFDTTTPTGSVVEASMPLTAV